MEIDLARQAGVNARGYYHRCLYDNFEWAPGFTPHFGLYHVDETSTSARPPSGPPC